MTGRPVTPEPPSDLLPQHSLAPHAAGGQRLRHPVCPGPRPCPGKPLEEHLPLQSLPPLPAETAAQLWGTDSSRGPGPEALQVQPGAPGVLSGNQAPTTAREQGPCFSAEAMPTLQCQTQLGFQCELPNGHMFPPAKGKQPTLGTRYCSALEANSGPTAKGTQSLLSDLLGPGSICLGIPEQPAPCGGSDAWVPAGRRGK